MDQEKWDGWFERWRGSADAWQVWSNSDGRWSLLPEFLLRQLLLRSQNAQSQSPHQQCSWCHCLKPAAIQQRTPRLVRHQTPVDPDQGRQYLLGGRSRCVWQSLNLKTGCPIMTFRHALTIFQVLGSCAGDAVATKRNIREQILDHQGPQHREPASEHSSQTTCNAPAT